MCRFRCQPWRVSSSGLASYSTVPLLNCYETRTTSWRTDYVGFFPTIGVALWVAASADCILELSTRMSDRPRELLIAGAVVGLIAAVDDAFQIHETASAHLEIPEPATFSLYAILYYRGCDSGTKIAHPSLGPSMGSRA